MRGISGKRLGQCRKRGLSYDRELGVSQLFRAHILDLCYLNCRSSVNHSSYVFAMLLLADSSARSRQMACQCRALVSAPE